MFESLKTWLEGLFRPVITLQQDGTSYLKVDPTINDFAVLKQRKTAQASVTYPGAASPNVSITVPQGDTAWYIREISWIGSTALQSCSANRVYYIIDGKTVYGYPSTAAYQTDLGMGLMGWSRGFAPVLLPGDTVGYRSVLTGAATITLTVVYSEVKIQ